MNVEMASALTRERQRELNRQASRYAARHNSDPTHSAAHARPARHIPRYRVSWSRMSLPAIGSAGRRERSWVIVISATKGL
jgi:hypothetical protein